MKTIGEYFINSGNNKVFISQPMKDKTTEEVRLEREDLVSQLSNKGYTVIDSVLPNPPENNNVGLWCLGESLKMLSNADYAYFMPGWENARGCKIEHECCKAYGIKIMKD